MKDCNECKYAEWQKTKTGRLHPSGDGKCTYKVIIPQLPASMCWSGFMATPRISGGFINRHEVFNDHCPYWSQS